jgi:hypothetical protein
MTSKISAPSKLEIGFSEKVFTDEKISRCTQYDSARQKLVGLGRETSRKSGLRKQYRFKKFPIGLDSCAFAAIARLFP